MNKIRIIGLVILVTTIGLAGISCGDTVIGNWEDSNDEWTVHSEAPEGTTMHPFKGNATLGNYSLKLNVPTGWQKVIQCDLSNETKYLEALGKAKQFSIDVTLVAKEWTLGSGWIKPLECIVVQDDMGDWQQLEPTADSDNSWNGTEDKKTTITFDIPPQTPPDLTRGVIIIVTQYDAVEKAGSFYYDNARLIVPGAEPNKPAAPKAAEPNKPAEAKPAAEPKKAAEPNKTK